MAAVNIHITINPAYGCMGSPFYGGAVLLTHAECLPVMEVEHYCTYNYVHRARSKLTTDTKHKRMSYVLTNKLIPELRKLSIPWKTP